LRDGHRNDLILTTLAHAQGTARTLAEVPQLLALAHAVEGPAGGGTLAPLAETLLDAVAESGCSEAAAQVEALRGATATRRAELAARRRQQMLASMSFSQASTMSSGTMHHHPHSQLLHVQLMEHLCIFHWITSRIIYDELVIISTGEIIVDRYAEHLLQTVNWCLRAWAYQSLFSQAGQPPAGSALALALAEVDDDDSDADGDQHVCMVCKEGYRQQPVRTHRCLRR